MASRVAGELIGGQLATLFKAARAPPLTGVLEAGQLSHGDARSLRETIAMNLQSYLARGNSPGPLVAVLALLAVALAQFADVQAAQPATQTTSTIPPDQLDSLVAPVALYPDPLLAQTLAASTYPLEIIQLQQWLAKNPGLKDKALADAVKKQPWDPSVQSMAAMPDLVKRLADDIQWTTDLGNAFLAQQKDVMDAVQRMR